MTDISNEMEQAVWEAQLLHLRHQLFTHGLASRRVGPAAAIVHLNLRSGPTGLTGRGSAEWAPEANTSWMSPGFNGDYVKALRAIKKRISLEGQSVLGNVLQLRAPRRQLAKGTARGLGSPHPPRRRARGTTLPRPGASPQAVQSGSSAGRPASRSYRPPGLSAVPV